MCAFCRSWSAVWRSTVSWCSMLSCLYDNVRYIITPIRLVLKRTSSALRSSRFSVSTGCSSSALILLISSSKSLIFLTRVFSCFFRFWSLTISSSASVSCYSVSGRTQTSCQISTDQFLALAPFGFHLLELFLRSAFHVLTGISVFLVLLRQHP